MIPLPEKTSFPLQQKKGPLTTCLLNGRRQRETAIYQQNRQQYVSVHTDVNSQPSSSSYCCTTWEMYRRGAFDQITNAIQMSLQMLVAFWHQAHAVITISTVSEVNPTTDKPTC